MRGRGLVAEDPNPPKRSRCAGHEGSCTASLYKVVLGPPGAVMVALMEISRNVESKAKAAL